ncbi:hypothetical protein [Pseudoroseicyclus aestuarii]|uniref:Class II vitamin B12-dependent ribonucleotide reductase n=1 Tax=Pseudoroseicyclus aestuarii TaxID=1795041 RepID=A0A318SN59_9RHOB|nr:hypothetical protein [Pseudoroseicyclus aestuarii]PYE81393.1 class II vitamin B12-dependent ribonucleotide reductase [Pseudoroseicyclus aestuarii]
MRIDRYFTTPGGLAHGGARLREARWEGVRLQVPQDWSALEVEMLARHGLVREGVPLQTLRVPEAGVPEWLWRSRPAPGTARGAETSLRQVVGRIAGAWTYHGWKGGYFTEEADARAYHDEMRHMLSARIAGPEREDWARLGLDWAYGTPAGAVPAAKGRAPVAAVRMQESIDGWHTCPAAGPIGDAASGDGFLFTDGTPCSPAAIDVAGFWRQGRFEAEGYLHAVRLWTLTLEIGVATAQHASPALAQRVQDLRPLGLGLANLSGLLMRMGLAYDSDAGRALCAALTAILTGTAYATSAEMAAERGAFPAHAQNTEAMARVIANHRRAAHGAMTGYEGLAVAPQPLDAKACPDRRLVAMACAAWDEAAEAGAAHGFRNAQVSLISPGGPIGAFMACDWGGIDPARALVEDRPTEEGGFARRLDPAVPEGLRSLGYAPDEVARITAHAEGHGTLRGAPGVTPEALAARGFGPRQMAALEEALPGAADLRLVFTRWVLGAEFCARTLGVPEERLADPALDLLAHLGFSPAQRAAANAHVFGAGTLEGAPDLDPAHLPVFDGLVPCGAGRRYVSGQGQLAMMAAAQAFVSGGIARALVLPEGLGAAELRAWQEAARRAGLKSLAIRSDPRLPREAAPEPQRPAAPLPVSPALPAISRPRPRRRGGLPAAASQGPARPRRAPALGAVAAPGPCAPGGAVQLLRDLCAQAAAMRIEDLAPQDLPGAGCARCGGHGPCHCGRGRA